MNRAVAILCLLAVVGVVFWFFPLFHVVSRDALRAERMQTAFNGRDYVNEFWTNKLTPALDGAADAAAVLAALRENPDHAREQFGRSAGLGRTSLYFVRGGGTIVSVDNELIGISLDGNETGDVAITTGLLFGNTLRDATGLIDGDDFPNSQHFNEISTELNRKVESSVIRPLKQRAKVGDTIEFVGCAEVTNVSRDIAPLKVVPLDVEFK
jgi:predicted lipoprotein